MTTYSQQDIERLISCAKVISDPPRKEMRVERGSRRNDMRLRSQEGELEFSVFMRVNDDFPENFSIGLEYRAARCAQQYLLAPMQRTARRVRRRPAVSALPSSHPQGQAGKH